MAMRGWKYPSVPTFTYTPPPPHTFAATRTGPDGHWICCLCAYEHTVYVQSGPHPLGVLKCICTHTPCDTCALSGSVKYFMPISEPATVLLRNGPHPGVRVDMDTPYGVVCGVCGLSLRAREVYVEKEKEKEKEGKRKTGKTGMRKIPSLSIRGMKRHCLDPKEGKLRKSKSLMDLVLPSARKPSSEKKKTKDGLVDPGKGKEENDKKKKEVVLPTPEQGQGQAEGKESGGVQSATVQFSGIKCKCGRYSNIESFCFWVTERNTAATRATTAQFTDMGHDRPVLRICGLEHPNPLRFCPV